MAEPCSGELSVSGEYRYAGACKDGGQAVREAGGTAAGIAELIDSSWWHRERAAARRSEPVC